MSAFLFDTSLLLDPLAEFRVGCHGTKNPAVKTVAFIGAEYDPERQSFSPRDVYWLKHSFAFFAEKKIPVSPSFHLVAPCARDGEDVYAPGFRLKADALIFGFNLDGTSETGKRHGKVGDVSSPLYVSPYASPEAYHQLLINSGAKTVVTFGVGSEVSAKSFQAPGYVIGPEKIVECPVPFRTRYAMETVFKEDLATRLHL